MKQIGVGVRAPRVSEDAPRKFFSWRFAQTAGIATCIVILATLIFIYVSLVRSGSAGPRQSDFVSYYSGSHLVLQGKASSLYRFDILGRDEESIVSPLRVRNGVLPFVYPPYFALVLVPLAALPYTLAFILWAIFNCALLVWVIHALQRGAGLEGRASLLWWAACLSLLPVFVALAQGQSSILVLALLAGCSICLLRGADAAAGILLGCASIKPQYVLPFLVVLLLTRKWRAIACMATCSLILLVVPIALFGSSIMSDYLHTLSQAATWQNQFGYAPDLNHSFSGFWQLLLPRPASTVITLVCVVAALAVLGWQAMKPNNLAVSLAMAATAALLISPHVLIHDLSLLLLPVGIAIGCRAVWPTPLAIILLVGSVLIQGGLWTVSVLPFQHTVLLMLALYVWLAVAGTKGTREPAYSRALLADSGVLDVALLT